jgi:hypothetical protein
VKLLVLHHEPSWWVWLVTALLLAVGLAGEPAGFAAAIAVSLLQTGYHFVRAQQAWKPFPVQIRLGYTVLLGAGLLPLLQWLNWLPAVGTTAFLLFGYCPMARLLSLLPWNRTEALSGDLVRRTFLTPPTLGDPRHGLPAPRCFAGACELEARIAAATKPSLL